MARTAPAVVAAWLALAGCGVAAPVFETGVAIENVTVVDVETGVLMPDRTVVLEGHRIAAVVATDRADLGAAVERYDGEGGYLIPGLWDMHVHAIAPAGRLAFPLFIANGVTGVRDMWGVLDAAVTLRAEVEDGTLAGPRFVVAGNLTDGGNPWWPAANVATTPAAGRALVDSLADAGAGFIKVYSVLTPDTYRAILETARARGLPVVGHVPMAITAREASELGQRSFAHLFGVPEGCSAAEAEIMAERGRWLADRAAGRPAKNPFFDPGLYRRMVDAHYPERCAALLEVLAANRTWQTPTLTVLDADERHDSTRIDDRRLAYVPEGVREGWRQIARLRDGRTPEDREANEALFRLQLRVLGRAHEADVPILAGTDTPNPFVYPGFSLHDELELLTEAGLSTLDALRAATLNPARFFHATDSLGSVEPGKLADLVVLDANPLEAIANTREIRLVVAAGRVYDRVRLDEILESGRVTAR